MDIAPRPFRILSLDGGGAKGVFTLGVLERVEASLGRPLAEVFDLIYGVSTGAIITAYLGHGNRVTDIYDRYLSFVPEIMSPWRRSTRSRVLRDKAASEFSGFTFSGMKTRIGLVSLNPSSGRPLIFKSHSDMVHSNAVPFMPGFGNTVADAVVASCAAYPYFEAALIDLPSKGPTKLYDGGFAANNPTLFAITDAVAAVGVGRASIRTLSVGVGTYPAPTGIIRYIHPRNWVRQWALIENMMDATANSYEFLRTAVCSDVPTVRINPLFDKPKYATTLTENNAIKLKRMFELGRQAHEGVANEIEALLR